MSNRKQKSGGQALVMVSLSLVAMSGMMGLAVDLGWSFYIQKEAQSAADGAALAAVQKAYKSMQSAGVVTSWSTCGNQNVICAPTFISCTAATGNLLDGCDYARANNFTDGGLGGKQGVQMAANKETPATPPWTIASRPNSPSPPVDIIYWATAKVSQNVPQLFSALLGNTQQSVAAIATAAVASKIINGSFWGMNRRGDCMFNGGTAASGFGFTSCGRDIDIAYPAAGDGVACGTSGESAFLCAPAGIIMSSDCTGASAAGCGSGATGAANGSNYAGQSGKVWGGPSISIAAANATGPSFHAVPTPTVAGSGTVDPYQGRPQPPVAAASSGSTPIPSCGYPAGVIPATTNHLGPMQYYSYRTVTVAGQPVKIPDAQPIQLPAGATFDATATGAAGCPGGVYTANSNSQSSNSSFKTFIFYGGINANGVGTVTYSAGQYILAGNNGSNSVPGATGGSDNVLAVKNSTFTGAQGVGEMFILTDGKYPGLDTQMAGVPNWNYNSGGNFSKIDPAQTINSEDYLLQGSVQSKNTNMTLYGFDKNALSTPIPALEGYSGLLVWQDRRNSTVIYDANGNVTKCWIGCASTPTNADYQANNVTATSPGLSLSDGNGSLVLKGGIYQPRGAWYSLSPGTNGVNNSPLQIFTGLLTGGGGVTNVTLTSPSIPIIGYVPALIQ